MARPSKIEPFIESAEQILFDDINTIIFTDQELVDAINENLDKKQQVALRTVQHWKQQYREGKELNGHAERFCTLIKKALRQQKQNLFKEFRNDSQWQKWAWIIERKFDEWNIKHKVDHTTKDNPMNGFQVEIGNANEG